jgi:hypothetical protein
MKTFFLLTTSCTIILAIFGICPLKALVISFLMATAIYQGVMGIATLGIDPLMRNDGICMLCISVICIGISCAVSLLWR